MSRAHVVCLLLALVTLLFYLPVRHFGFVDYDDVDYITQNPMVQAGLTWTGVKWAFTTWHASNWHPLTWLSHMLDCQLFGLNAGGHHLVNALFHTINAVLLFLLLLRLTSALWQSALVAALFAWHPLRVESVAWVAERKDVLSAFFGLLALMAYVRYAQKRSKAPSRESSAGTAISSLDARHSTLDYCLALLFFALGLMAKPMLVTLPFVFLLLDYWPLQRVPGFEFRVPRWSRLVLEKGPFFVVAATSCVVTFIAQQRGESVASLEWYPLGIRLENAVVSYANYLIKIVCPVNLAVIYPLPKEIPSVQVVAATVVLVTISWLSWRARQEKPYLLTGWLWFLGMLVPVIGLVQVGMQAMADRYTYLPAIGVLIGVTFGLGDAAAKLRPKPAIVILIAGCVLAGCLLAAARQLRFWRDSETLFDHALAVTKDNYVAHNNLGIVFLQKGQVDKAVAHFRRTVEIHPLYAKGRNNLGFALLEKGQVAEAMAHLQMALEIQPGYLDPHYNLGLAFLRKGQADKAIAHFEAVLKIKRNLAPAHNKLGVAFLQNGQVEKAISHFETALELNPQFIGPRTNLAWILATAPDASLRNGAKAVELAEEANRLSGSKDPAALGTLAAAYAEAGRFPEAVATAQWALQLADAQTHTTRIDSLRAQIECYRTASPFRDTNIINMLTSQGSP